MLWIPDRKTRKALARKKRRRRRRRIARLLLFLFLFFGLGAASVPPEQDLLTQADRITATDQFDFIDWESRAIAGEIRRRLTPPSLPPTETEQQTLVQKFLDLEANSRQRKDEINRFYAISGSAPNTSPQVIVLEQELAQVKAAQVEIAPQVETLLARQVETVLQIEGFELAGRVFPPVAFRLVDPPTALILSPRNRIENQHFTGLQPGLDNGRRFEIEEMLDRRGDVSSYITNVGGLGSYPTMVINTSNLSTLIDIAAHEWTHNYLFTFPTNVAWGYQTYPRLTTINETTATLVAGEISRKVITRYYPAWIDRLPPVDDTGIPLPPEPSEFDQAMRRIRQQVDQLLAEGKIDEAEAYMEVERLKLVEKGYNLRKLNQAYFAFHGSYAFGPASIDPTGSQLRQLRAASPSLKIFLDRVGWLNSYGDHLAWLEEVGVK
jgi:hypothetical protein